MSFLSPLEDGIGLFSRPRTSLLLVGLFLVLPCAGMIWLLGSRNPYTPAGYVGYLTRGAVFGKSIFYGTQRGPTSAGRRWLLDVTNVSITPYTYTEGFTGDEAVLSKADGGHEKEPDAIVKVAYGNFIREPLRTFARAEGDGQFAEPHRRLHSGGTDGRADHWDVPDGTFDRGSRYTIDVTAASASMMR
jgi:hypothetical protein